MRKLNLVLLMGIFMAVVLSLNFVLALDNYAGTIKITSPKNGLVTIDNSIYIRVDAVDKDGIKQIIVGNQATGSANSYIYSSSLYVWSVTNKDMGRLNLVRGTNRIVATVIDKYGNYKTSYITVTKK